MAPEDRGAPGASARPGHAFMPDSSAHHGRRHELTPFRAAGSERHRTLAYGVMAVGILAAQASWRSGRWSVKRIGILVVAYNAASTLASVLDRIPDDFVPRIAKVLVSDDSSHDATYLVGLGYQQLSADVPTRDRPPSRGTSATAATRRPATAGRSSRTSTSSCCCTATASTRPSFCPRSSRRSSATSATRCSARG